ncbi:unnamed protein product, partial [Callosobruchus maculatus]
MDIYSNVKASLGEFHQSLKLLSLGFISSSVYARSYSDNRRTCSVSEAAAFELLCSMTMFAMLQLRLKAVNQQKRLLRWQVLPL